MDDLTSQNRAGSGVASFLIPKIVQNRIRGCFITHPQKFSYINESIFFIHQMQLEKNKQLNTLKNTYHI
jgi:hypothetical protein